MVLTWHLAAKIYSFGGFQAILSDFWPLKRITDSHSDSLHFKRSSLSFTSFTKFYRTHQLFMTIGSIICVYYSVMHMDMEMLLQDFSKK